MNNNLITVGTRGIAKQAKTAAIMLIVLAAFFALIGLLLGFSMMASGEEAFVAGLVTLLVLLLLAAFLIFYSVISLRYAKNNDTNLFKPVLAYDQENDSFVGYDCRHNNKEMIFKNGEIIDIKGSALWTARELFVYYNKNGKIKKVSLGFCRNIDNHVFRDELNKYSKIKF